MSEPIRLGIIGAGAIVQVAHLPVLKRLKGIEVVAICDTDLPKARALAERYQIRGVFDDLQDLLANESLDALLLCTPNHMHEPHILAGLSAGLHVLVEKPLAMTTASAQKLVRAAEKRDRVVMVGMSHRYRPDAQAIRQFVLNGELGEIDSVRGSWHVARPSRAQFGWRQRKEQAGGGVMLDLGLTVLDLSLWLIGNPRPIRVSASLSRAGRGDRAIEQSGSAFVVCENDLSIFLDVTWRNIGDGERFGVGIRGSKGSAGINPLQVWKEMHGMAHDVSPTGSGSRENPYTASFRAQWAHFMAAVAGGVPQPPLQDHVVLHEVLEAIYKSAESGRDVLL